jgi:hypothetical protein
LVVAPCIRGLDQRPKHAKNAAHFCLSYGLLCLFQECYLRTYYALDTLAFKTNNSNIHK